MSVGVRRRAVPDATGVPQPPGAGFDRRGRRAYSGSSGLRSKSAVRMPDRCSAVMASGLARLRSGTARVSDAPPPPAPAAPPGDAYGLSTRRLDVVMQRPAPAGDRHRPHCDALHRWHLGIGRPPEQVPDPLASPGAAWLRGLTSPNGRCSLPGRRVHAHRPPPSSGARRRGRYQSLPSLPQPGRRRPPGSTSGRPISRYAQDAFRSPHDAVARRPSYWMFQVHRFASGGVAISVHQRRPGTNGRWKSRISDQEAGADVISVAAAMIRPVDALVGQRQQGSPTVSGREPTASVTTIGHRKLFQWSLTNTSP